RDEPEPAWQVALEEVPEPHEVDRLRRVRFAQETCTYLPREIVGAIPLPDRPRRGVEPPEFLDVRPLVRHGDAFIGVARDVLAEDLEALVVGAEFALVRPARFVRRLDVARDRVGDRILPPRRHHLV